MGQSLCALTAGLTVLPYFMYLSTQLTGMDANLLFGRIMLGINDWNVFIAILRKTLIFGFISNCRFFAIIVCVGMIVLDMGITGLEHLTKATRVRTLIRIHINQFKQLQIAFVQCELCTSHIAAYLMIVGFVFSIIFIFLAIRLHDKPHINIVMYLIYPSISMITLAVIKIAIHMAEGVYERASLVVQNFSQKQSNKTGYRELFRIVQTLRSPRISFGINLYNFSSIKKETKTVYYQAIFDNVNNALLTYSL